MYVRKIIMPGSPRLGLVLLFILASGAPILGPLLPERGVFVRSVHLFIYISIASRRENKEEIYVGG